MKKHLASKSALQTQNNIWIADELGVLKTSSKQKLVDSEQLIDKVKNVQLKMYGKEVFDLNEQPVV